jgi:YggT family protein
VAAVLAVALAQVAALYLARGLGFPDTLQWLQLGARELIRGILWLYFWSIFVYSLLSMIAPGTYSPIQGVLQSICEPVLRPIRRTVPPLAGLDLSPLWAAILIQLLLILVR